MLAVLEALIGPLKLESGCYEYLTWKEVEKKKQIQEAW
jgi:hypothetical protein